MAVVDKNIKDIVLAWLRVSPEKMMVATICGILSYMGWYTKDEFKFLIHVAVENYARTYETNFDLPTSLSGENVISINNTIKNFLTYHTYVGAATLYEFVPKGSDILYQGRIAVVSANTSGKDLLTRYNSKWLPMNVNRFLIEKILRGEPYTRPTNLEGDITDSDSPDTTNYYLVKQDGFEMVICVPVLGSSGQVKGYISFLLLAKPTTQDELLVKEKELSKLAIELSQYFIE